MILQAGSHLINIDRVTHIGPGTGGNNSTFHFEGGGIAVTDLTHEEIATLLSETTGGVTQHIDELRAGRVEPEPEEVIDDSEWVSEDEV